MVSLALLTSFIAFCTLATLALALYNVGLTS